MPQTVCRIEGVTPSLRMSTHSAVTSPADNPPPGPSSGVMGIFYLPNNSTCRYLQKNHYLCTELIQRDMNLRDIKKDIKE